jgi:hypothetical protein
LVENLITSFLLRRDIKYPSEKDGALLCALAENSDRRKHEVAVAMQLKQLWRMETHIHNCTTTIVPKQIAALYLGSSVILTMSPWFSI